MDAPNLNILHEIYKAQLSDKEFEMISRFIQEKVGIKMPEIKRTMVQSRLYKRLKELQMNNFSSYIQYAFKDENSEEIVHLIDSISTNKTEFFREADHFDYISTIYLPLLMRTRQPSVIKAWSAGCSSGEEPYTLGVVLSEFLQAYPSVKFEITGTDISTKVLEKARIAIYNEDKTANIPFDIKRRYFLKSKDREHPTVKVVPELRQNINFQRLNLMDNSYSVAHDFHIILCRNVLIYFSRENQECIINKLCNHLVKGGLLLIGHSESLLRMNLPLRQIKPTVFERI